MSILAGMMIAIGCLLYLQIGGVAGACLFAVGLGTVYFFNLKLFTGQAGKLATYDIKPWELLQIWVGNFIGVGIIAGFVITHPNYEQLQAGAQAILNARVAENIWLTFARHFILAIPCGMLMYCAVSCTNTLKLIYIIMCVAAFILCGFYHCVADMFYTIFAANSWEPYVNLLFVTIGNVLGCNLIPIVKQLY